MSLESENDNSNCKCDTSDLDKKNETKYTSPTQKVYLWAVNFISHLIYLLIYIFFIYSFIVFDKQVCKSGVFDEILSSKIGGYCAPFFIKDTKENPPENEYVNISLYDLTEFDYRETSEKFTHETDEYTYGYGVVSFNKKFINYLYNTNWISKKYFNLSNYIKFIEYDDNLYSYDDNLLSSTVFRKSIFSNWLWVLIDIVIVLPIMFFIDTTRKFLAYNIYAIAYVYKSLHNYIHEGLLLLILGFLFIYYRSYAFLLIIGIPLIVTGITFFLVFIYNLFFQVYHYASYSLKILEKLTKQTNSSKNFFYNNFISSSIIYFYRLLGTILKIILVFLMMIVFYVHLSSPVVVFITIYTLVFLYIVMPVYFKGNILDKNKVQEFININDKNDKETRPDETTEDKINLSNIVNKTEDYSIINVWKGLTYKVRYFYFMATIIFIIDLSLSEILDKKYNYISYIIGIILLLIFLARGFFFNKLIVTPKEVPTAVPVQKGGNYISKFFQNKTYSQNSIPYFINNINNFSKNNPLSIIKNIKFEKKLCERNINDNSYVITFEEVFDKIFKYDDKNNIFDIESLTKHVDKAKPSSIGKTPSNPPTTSIPPLTTDTTIEEPPLTTSIPVGTKTPTMDTTIKAKPSLTMDTTIKELPSTTDKSIE